MKDLIIALILRKEISDKDIENVLVEICDKQHSYCSDKCPVFALNVGKLHGCDCFRNGKAMLEFIREHSKKED